MRKSFLILVISIVVLSLTAVKCNQIESKKEIDYKPNQATLTLDPNHKLVEIAFRDNEMWILTKPMEKKDTTNVYYFERLSINGESKYLWTIKEIKE